MSPSPKLGSEGADIHRHTGMGTGQWLSLSGYWGHIPPTTAAGTKKKGFETRCTAGLSPFPGSTAQSGHLIEDGIPKNWGPLSETTSTGIQWSWKTWFSSSWPVSLAEGSLRKGTKWAILEKRSTMVRMTVFPSEGGRPVTKSMEISDRGGAAPEVVVKSQTGLGVKACSGCR